MAFLAKSTVSVAKVLAIVQIIVILLEIILRIASIYTDNCQVDPNNPDYNGNSLLEWYSYNI